VVFLSQAATETDSEARIDAAARPLAERGALVSVYRAFSIIDTDKQWVNVSFPAATLRRRGHRDSELMLCGIGTRDIEPKIDQRTDAVVDDVPAAHRPRRAGL